MERDPRKEQDSLAPVSLEGLSLGEELALLQSDRQAQLWRWFSGAMVLALLFGLTTRGLDAAQARQDARTHLARLVDTDLQAFLACALPAATASRITSRERLHSLLERQVALVPRFGERLSSCLPDLLAFQRGLANMHVPSEAAEQHDQMLAAIRLLRDRVDHLAIALTATPELDYVRSTGLIGRITLAHEAFVEARERWRASLAP